MAVTDHLFYAKNLTLVKKDVNHSIPFLKGVNFFAPKGKILALIAEDKCSIDLMFQAALGLSSQTVECISGGIFYGQKNLFDLKTFHLQKMRGNRMALFDPSFCFQQRVVNQFSDQISWNQRYFQKKQLRLMIVHLLSHLGVDRAQKYLDALMHELDSKTLFQIQFALSIINEPDVLFITGVEGMEMFKQLELARLLSVLPNKQDMVVVLVTSSPHLTQMLADDVGFFHQTQLIEFSSCVDFFACPKTENAKIYLHHYWRDQTKKVFPKAHKNQSPFLSIQKLKAPAFLFDLSFHVYPNECLGIFTEHTFQADLIFNVLSGWVQFKGKLSGFYRLIDVYGEQLIDLAKKRDQVFYENIQFLNDQTVQQLSPYLTVNDQFLILHSVCHQKDDIDLQVHINQCFKWVGLGAEVQNLFVDELTHDQRFLVALAKSLYFEPSVLVYQDSVIQSQEQRWQFVQLLQNAQKQLKNDLSILIVSSDLHLIEYFSNRMIKVD